MEQSSINNPKKIKIKASELLSKFRHREDRYNFCREKSKFTYLYLDVYLPNEIYFDTTFFLKWLSGKKKVIINI